MKITLTAIVCFLFLGLKAQEDKTVIWINNNLIEIEDAHLDSTLRIFHDNISKNF